MRFVDGIVIGLEPEDVGLVMSVVQRFVIWWS